MIAVAASVVAFVGACGDDSGSSLELSAAGAEGRRVANSQAACGSCHGRDGQGGVGPAFVGLYGSQVELDDGTTVVADETYLEESIRDPNAKRAAGITSVMPETNLDDDEIAAIITYIKELAGPAEPAGRPAGDQP